METTLAAFGLTAFFTEMFAPLLLCSSIPLGVPPAPEDKALAQMAPQECVFWCSWAGTATPDPKSKNRAERFLADPEIRQLRAEAARRFQHLIHSAGDSNPVLDKETRRVIGDDLGFWCESLVARPGALFVSRLGTDHDPQKFEGGLVLNVRDVQARVATMLQHYAKIANGSINDSQVGGHTEYRVDMDSQIKVRWGLWDQYLIVAWGEQSPEQIARRMKGVEPKWLAAIDKNLPVQRRATVLRIDFKPIIAAMAANDAQKDTAQQMSRVGLRAATLVSGLEGEDFVSRALVELDDIVAKPLYVAMNRPLGPAQLTPIPDDALLAVAGRVDPHWMVQTLLWYQKVANHSDGNDQTAGEMPHVSTVLKSMLVPDSLKGVLPDSMTQSGEDSKGDSLPLDEKLCHEIASSLGDSWCCYTSLTEGSFFTATARIKDRERLTKIFERLAASHPAGAKAGKKQTWAIGKGPFAGRDIYYLLREGKDATTTSAWCLTDKDLVWSWSPSSIKAYLLREAQGPTLAQTPAVAEVVRTAPAPSLLFYENTPAFFRYSYPWMQLVASVAAGQHNLHLNGPDPMLLPAPPTIVKYLRPAVSSVRATPRGVELTVRQSLPCGNLGATLWVVGCSMLPADQAWLGALNSNQTAAMGTIHPVPAAQAVMVENSETKPRDTFPKGAHTGFVESVAFSPDGKTLASGSEDQTIKLWDVATGGNIATLKGHTGSVEAVAFSPDGKTLASGSSDQTVKLWDVASGKNTITLKQLGNMINSVAFSPDGRTLAVATGNGNNAAVARVVLWDVASRGKIATLKGHSAAVNSLAFSPDGKTLASGSDDHTVKLWDVTTQKNIATLEGQGQPNSLESVAFSPDGKTLASGSLSSTIAIWDVATRKNTATFGGSGAVSSVAFSPDGKTLAAGGWNKTITLWDVKAGGKVAK